MSETLLEVEGLRIDFAQYERGLRRRVVTAVEGMSLSVGPGELVALVGASGAGKSLLGHAVLGMLPPNAREAGTVSWRGRPVDVRRRRSLAGREIALLPQSLTHLDPTSRVLGQVRRSARLAGAPDADAAARVALADRELDEASWRRFPHELSGGMARRVLAAMALLGDPALVIADEPTPGLHPESVAAILARLRGLADAGAGVLLITHDLVGAVGVADRVVVCDRGRTLEQVPVSAFSGAGEQLTHPYSRALWQAMPHNGMLLDGASVDDPIEILRDTTTLGTRPC